jgi:hypothetical protein
MKDRKQPYRLRIVPLELRELNAFVAQHHRHHKPVQGHRFSIGVIRDDTNLLVGGCSIGRPVARLTSQKWICEVTRLVTDGTPNACSALYSAAARAAQNMGYERIQTFILDSETGGSLKASGWEFESVSPGGAMGAYVRPKTDRSTNLPKAEMVKNVEPANQNSIF